MDKNQRKQILERIYMGRKISGIVLIDDAVKSVYDDATRDQIGAANEDNVGKLTKAGFPQALFDATHDKEAWDEAWDGLEVNDFRTALTSYQSVYAKSLSTEVRSLYQLHPMLVACHPSDFEKIKGTFEDHDAWLFVVDLHFNAAGTDKGGLQCVSEIHNKYKDSPKILLSLDFNGKEYWDYTKDRNLDDGDKTLLKNASVVLLSREDLLKGDSDGFEVRLEVLHYSLFKPDMDSFRSSVEEHLKDAMANALEYLQGVSPLDFDQAMFSSATSDGGWPPFTFMEVAKRLMEAEFYRIDGDKQPTRRLMEANHSMSQGKGVFYNHLPYAGARDLYRKQYEFGNEINAACLPLANGDMFALEGDDKFVFIAQPCDLQVRSVSYGAAFARSQSTPGILLPIEEYDDRPGLAYHKLTARTSDGDKRYLNMGAYRRVDLRVLDCCALNQDGTALMPKEEPQHWSPGYESHLKGIHGQDFVPASEQAQIFEAKREALLVRKGIVEDDLPPASPHAGRPAWAADIDSHWNHEEYLMQADVRRIGRLADVEAQQALQAFHDYHSRPGLATKLLVKDPKVAE